MKNAVGALCRVEKIKKALLFLFLIMLIGIYQIPVYAANESTYEVLQLKGASATKAKKAPTEEEIKAANDQLEYENTTSAAFLEQQDNEILLKPTWTVKRATAGFYKLLFSIGVMGLVIEIVYIGVQFAIVKHSQKKHEIKSHVIWIIVGATLLFGAFAIVGWFNEVGNVLSSM